MAHFAKLGLNSKVIAVNVVSDDIAVTEEAGKEFLLELTGYHFWVQTSYNTYGGQHKLGGTPFRKNFAAKGMTYDEDRDAFIPKKLYNSWTLNETTCLWEAPIPEPEDGNHYHWNEETQQWDVDS
jgi:hypothetical protein|tara:strand:- start:851 stop:1225 length:375 start_codon:yes stop_codon:yes gene_type:complete